MKLKKRSLHRNPTPDEYGFETARVRKEGQLQQQNQTAAGTKEISPSKDIPKLSIRVTAAAIILTAIAIVIIVLLLKMNGCGSASSGPEDSSDGSSVVEEGLSGESGDSGSRVAEDPVITDEPDESSDEEESASSSAANEESGGEDTAESESEDAGSGQDAPAELTPWQKAMEKVTEPGYVWTTASSIGAKRQFWSGQAGDRLMNYAGMGEDDYYQLVSVTNVTGIADDHGDGVEYVYYLDGGLQYYMREDNEEVLECYWEPDGYSMSDSLERINDNVSEDMKVIDLSGSGSEELVVLESQNLSVFTGYYGDHTADHCIALNLKEPVLVRMPDESETILHSIQVYGETIDSLITNRNLEMDFDGYEGYEIENTSNNLVSGKLRVAETNMHYTPVIMEVTGID